MKKKVMNPFDLCLVSLGTAANMDSCVVVCSASSSIQSSTELSRDKFSTFMLGVRNVEVFKVLKRFSQPVLNPTLLLS